MENGDVFDKPATAAAAQRGFADKPTQPAWRALVRYCAELQHGEIELLKIQDGLFTPPSAGDCFTGMNFPGLASDRGNIQVRFVAPDNDCGKCPVGTHCAGTEVRWRRWSPLWSRRTGMLWYLHTQRRKMPSLSGEVSLGHTIMGRSVGGDRPTVAGYQPATGHAATGSVVAVLCPLTSGR